MTFFSRPIFSMITPPPHTSHHRGSCQRVSFPPTALQINVPTLNKSDRDLWLILPFLTSVVLSHCGTQGYRIISTKVQLQSNVTHFSCEIRTFWAAEHWCLLFSRIWSFMLFILYASLSTRQILIIQKHRIVKGKVFHRICFFLLTFTSGSKVLSLQDCTPFRLLKDDLLSSHFTPGIKSAHTQTYTHKVENIRAHTYIIAHSSLINHEKIAWSRFSRQPLFS